MARMRDSISAFAEHVAATSFAHIETTAVAAAKTFVLDTLGVGIGGSIGPNAAALPDIVQAFGRGDQARVWGTGEALPPSAAAMCNAYRTHCSEFDCVHEAAVVHVMTIVLPAALAEAEHQGDVDGKRLIEAVILGVDVAAGIGQATQSGLKFFRPATAGTFGGVAAIAKLRNLSVDKLVMAFSIAYGQLCGTMQAHTEGSSLLAMQIGFGARNAVAAVTLAEHGITGPINVLDGEFGYFNLFENSGDATSVISQLGKKWCITDVAHKPFPSGRATHGIVDACLTLKRAHDISCESIATVSAEVPQLVHQLVGRAPRQQMDINYARLCARYVAACALIDGNVAFSDFNDDAYLRLGHRALADKIDMSSAGPETDGSLTPVSVEIVLTDGTRHRETVASVYGCPGNPMTYEAQLAKFRENCANALRPVPMHQVDDMIATIADLETASDVSRLIDLSIA